jgi:hypothetical protein
MGSTSDMDAEGEKKKKLYLFWECNPDFSVVQAIA